MRRAYVFRLRPTARQHAALAACVESHRELYNAALQERRDAWAHSKTRIFYGSQSAQLTETRAVRPDVEVWSFSSQQATLRRLNKAFAGFFRRVKTAKPAVKPGYPRFKGAGRFDSVEWPKDGDGARWLPEAKRVYLQGIGQVKVDLHRQAQGWVKTIQIKRQGRRWVLVLSCDDVPTNPLPATGRQAGIDVGIVSSPPPATVSMSTIHAGAARRRTGWPRRSSGWPAPSVVPKTANVGVKLLRRGIARSPTSVRTFTTNRPATSWDAMTFWWWRIYRSPT
jgi:transposase